jgi:hypothetical protein
MTTRYHPAAIRTNTHRPTKFIINSLTIYIGTHLQP